MSADNPTTSVEYRDLSFLGLPGYRIGNDGSGWSRRKGHGEIGLTDHWRPLKPALHRFGHHYFNFRFDGKLKSILVHRLVLMAFVGPCPAGMECCHNDGNKTNNRLENLRWDTRRANLADSIRHGTQPRGSRQGSSKLDESQVAEILDLTVAGWKGCDLARKFGVCKQTITLILQNRTWQHVPRPTGIPPRRRLAPRGTAAPS